MKKIISIIITTVLILVSSGIGFGQERNNDIAKQNYLRQLSINEIIAEMIDYYDESGNINALINYAVVLDERVNTIEENLLTKYILNNNLSEDIRLVFLQLGERKANINKKRWEEMCISIINDSLQPTVLKIDALWQLSNGGDTVKRLKEYVYSDDERLSFQALKRLYLEDKNVAETISRDIISEYQKTGEETEVLRKAIRIYASEIGKTNSLMEKVKVNNLCIDILEHTSDSRMVDAVFFALNDLNDLSAINTILNEKKIDRELKEYCINTNQDILKRYIEDCDTNLNDNLLSEISNYAVTTELKSLLKEKGLLTDSSKPSRAASSYVGYALFRDGDGINIDWHAGLLNRSTSTYSDSVIHLKKTSAPLNVDIVKDSWSGFLAGNTFKGVYGPRTAYTSSQANQVIAKARELVGESVQYTVTEQLTYHSATSTGTSKGEPSDIYRIRCDGVVEYCFEYNDIIIWGANSQYGNISIKNSRNVDYHRGGYIVPSTQAGVMNLITTATP